MANPEYLAMDAVRPDAFLSILNDTRVRKHLMPHEPFELESLTAWINGKLAVDAIDGCIVRAVLVRGALVGWCGIQREDGRYEIAVVIRPDSSGVGQRIFRDIMAWAKAFGHERLFVNLLHTRPLYQFLRRHAINVRPSEIAGNRFLSYELAVEMTDIPSPGQPHALE